MSFLSRLFGRKNPECGTFTGPNSKPGRGGGLPAAGPSTTADLSNVPPQTLSARRGDTQETTVPAAESHRPPAGASYDRGDLIRGVCRVENVLAGGMGVVYICRQLSLEEIPESNLTPYRPLVGEGASETLVSPRPAADESPRYHAFKSFRRELLFHEDVRRRFDREALLWVSLLPHPNVVRAQSFFNDPLLWLEYVDGGNLGCLLGQPLPFQKVADIAMQFCSGMIFLFESAGIVHRDIKPANILLTQSGTVKITDFGLAKAFSHLPESTIGSQRNDGMETNSGFATQCGTIMGSLPWMSPEQFTSPSEVTVVSDVYSFGVVLYEMLTGKMPYAASNAPGWMRKVLNEIPVSPARASGVSEEASAIAMKCLEKRPEHRYRDFVELRAALECCAVRKGWPGMVPAPVSTAELESAMTARAWMNRGYALGQLGRNEDSYQSYLRALELDPTDTHIHGNLGTALMRLGRFEEGLRHHQEQTEIDPNGALSWDTLANGYLNCNRLPEALDASRRAAEAAPEHIAILRQHANIARLTGANSEYERAVTRIKALLTLPKYDTLRSIINEAIQFCQYGDLKVGLELHLLSAQKYPDEALAWYNFAVSMHKCGQLEQAIGFYSRAIQLDSKSTMAFIYRGVIRVHRSEYDLARSDWQAANVCDPKNQLCQMVQILLQDNLVQWVKQHPQLKDFWENLNSPSTLRYFL